MATLAMTDNPDTGAWDLSIESGRLSLLSGLDATAQRITYEMLFIRGEWFLDRLAGFPWFDLVFQNKTDPTTIQHVLIAYLLGIPGVLELLEIPTLQIDRSARTLAIQVRARTNDGEVATTVAGGI